MSLVADVLAISKESGSQADARVTEIEKLFKQAEEARDSVCQSLGSHYVTLSSTSVDLSNLQTKLKKCLEDSSLLETNIKTEIIPSVKGSAGEIERVTSRWKEMKAELEATQLLLDIHTLRNDAEAALLSNNFDVAVCNLNKIEDLLDEANSREVESQLDILTALREELLLKRTDIICRGGELWNKFISFNEEEEDKQLKAVTLSIQNMSADKKEKKTDCTRQTLAALNALGELQAHVCTFGKNLLQYFIRPILCEGGKLEFLSLDSGVDCIHVRKSLPEKVRDPTSAMEALTELESVFHFLEEHFLSCSFDDDGKEVHLISLLGAEIGDEFIQLVLDCCLEESVPCDRKNLEQFSQVQTQVEQFHQLLVNIGFYGKDHKSLLNYVANVETVYGNKTCSNILMKARNLMVKALHVTTTIAPLEPDGPLVAADEFGNELKDASLRLQNLSPKTFNFPKCKISVSLCELVTIIYDTLEEGCISTPEFARRLFNTVRNILSMYHHVIPMAHAHALSTAPEQAALVHNNSLFLSHHALLIGHNYGNRFPECLQSNSFTVADVAYLIRSSGCEVFLKCMQGHKNTLIDMLRKGIESPSIKSDANTFGPFQSSVQECILLLKRLCQAWKDILPHCVYVKAMGTLAGSVVEDLVLRIVALEEISADEAISLIGILSLLTTKIPPLFEDVDGDRDAALGEATKEVRLWEKMNELIVVLGASLRDLEERWMGSKGPLAYHFTAAEVKHLIRAIFQNTERRAQLLAKIK